MVDFYPTLAELADLQAPDYLSGVSLVPILKNTDSEVRKSALSQYMNGYSIRDKRYRYTEWGQKGSEGRELYDHKSDPEELNNLAGNPAHEKLIKRLAALLHDRIANANRTPGELLQVPVERVQGPRTSSTFAPK